MQVFRKIAEEKHLIRLLTVLAAAASILLVSCGEPQLGESEAAVKRNPRQEVAYQTQIKILEPISGSRVFANMFDANEFNHEIVVSFSRPVPQNMVLRFASRVGNTQELHITTQYFQFDENREVASSLGTTDLKNDVVVGKTITLWAVLAGRTSSVGDTYPNMDAMRRSLPGAFISEPVTVGIESMPH